MQKNYKALLQKPLFFKQNLITSKPVIFVFSFPLKFLKNLPVLLSICVINKLMNNGVNIKVLYPQIFSYSKSSGKKIIAPV